MTKSVRYKIHPAIGVGTSRKRSGIRPLYRARATESAQRRIRGRGHRRSALQVRLPGQAPGGTVSHLGIRRERRAWTPSCEVSELDDDIVSLTWVVHLANRCLSIEPRGVV